MGATTGQRGYRAWSTRRVVGVELERSGSSEAELHEPLPGFWILLYWKPPALHSRVS